MWLAGGLDSSALSARSPLTLPPPPARRARQCPRRPRGHGCRWICSTRRSRRLLTTFGRRRTSMIRGSVGMGLTCCVVGAGPAILEMCPWGAHPHRTEGASIPKRLILIGGTLSHSEKLGRREILREGRPSPVGGGPSWADQ